jgi:hypothetical protein
MFDDFDDRPFIRLGFKIQHVIAQGIQVLQQFPVFFSQTFECFLDVCEHEALSTFPGP